MGRNIEWQCGVTSLEKSTSDDKTDKRRTDIRRITNTLGMSNPVICSVFQNAMAMLQQMIEHSLIISFP